jgi:hypothetical protein
MIPSLGSQSSRAKEAKTESSFNAAVNSIRQPDCPFTPPWIHKPTANYVQSVHYIYFDDPLNIPDMCVGLLEWNLPIFTRAVQPAWHLCQRSIVIVTAFEKQLFIVSKE